MGDTGLVQIVSFVAVASFAFAFGAISLHSSRYHFARWFSATFVLGATALLISFFVPATTHFGWVGFARACVILATSSCALIGVLLYRQKTPPWAALALLATTAPIVSFLCVFLGAPTIMRSLAFNLPPVTVYVMCALIFLNGKNRETFDKVIALCLLAMATSVLSRTLGVALASGSSVQEQVNFLAEREIYWKAAAGILGIIMGAMFLVRFIKDILYDARTDPLSGLLNRAAFEDKAGLMLKEADRNNITACVIVTDLDSFKQINDRFGHAAGDEAIAAFASIILKPDNADILAGRLGGDEFGILATGANQAVGELLAESIRSAYAITPIDNVPTGIEKTASFGIAEHIKGQSLSELVRRADAALYDAKKGGRDRVANASSATDAFEDKPGKLSLVS